ncbi:MAG: hypothetical protein WB760_07320 [Xanthobacteraceae bacterium]
MASTSGNPANIAAAAEVRMRANPDEVASVIPSRYLYVMLLWTALNADAARPEGA